MKKTFALLSIVVLIASCANPSPSINPPAYWPTNGWQSSTPEQQGMDSNVLASMFDHITEQHINLRSLLIIRNGYLVTDAYFQPYTAETPHTIESITKSVIDALIGIAIDQKYIKDADQSLLSFYPADRRIDNLDANKQAIKLKDLLSLTVGFECDDAPSSENRTMTQSGNWVAFMLNSPMAAAPGTTFNYCSGAVHVLSDVLQRSVNMSAREFANEQLFKPLGIPAVPPERWGTDPQQVSTGGFGLYLTPRDVAKLGLLYLNNGRWAGQQIVPADWVAASTTQHAIKEDGTGYGYLWTVYPNEDRYAALGLAGQQLHILPKQNLVVVFTSGLPVYGEAPQLNDLIKNYIVPAVKSDTALPANSIGVAELNADIQAVAHPQQPVTKLPSVAQTISGQTYRVDDNPFGWQTLTFNFQPDSAVASLVIATSQISQQGDIGLDNLYRDAPSVGGLRGHWANDSTFIAEQVQLGQIVEYEYRLTFNASDLNLEMTERVFGGEPLRLHAKLQTAPQPVMPAFNDTLPEACRVAGQELYVNPYDGYCFAYPSTFELKMSQTGQPELYGPALDQNLDPLRAVLNMEVEVAAQNANLTQIVDEYLKQFSSLNVPPITRMSITFGGEPAEQLEVVPGLAGSRDIFVLHNGTLYHLLFMPSIRDYPQATANVEELYKSVTASFSFTSKKPRPLPTP